MRTPAALLILWTLIALPNLAEDAKSIVGAEAQSEARVWEPSSSFFYINGIAYRFAAAESYAVVAAATTGLGGKYLGIKVHVFNRSRQSITVLPEDITVVDAIAKRRLTPVPAVDVVNRKRGEPTWMRFAGNVAGPGEPVGDLVNPQWNELVRALQPEITSSARANSTAAVYSSQKLQVDGPDCDTACQLRNREVNSSLSSGWQQNLSESIQNTAFLANTIPPQCDIEGVLYFLMPRQAATDPGARRRSKSYAITITVPVAGERFNLDFPVD